MVFECNDCGASIIIPTDVLSGEIIGCKDCGLDFVMVLNNSGNMMLEELLIEGEDWGE
jgi:lysine biosynthesis protein LysW